MADSKKIPTAVVSTRLPIPEVDEALKYASARGMTVADLLRQGLKHAYAAGSCPDKKLKL